MATTILTLSQIKEHLPAIDLIPLIENAFVAYSKGDAVIPPVGELILAERKGETHIKYGYIKNESYYVVKIASGFSGNQQLGLSNSQGVMLLFSQKTGELTAILLDEGYLTDVRTVIASMITIKRLAPSKIRKIGIIGTGLQAQLQLKFLEKVSDCKDIVIWGRDKRKAESLSTQFKSSYTITIAQDPTQIADLCNVIITTTSSKEPLLDYSSIKKGTHITALGSDTAEKIELSTDIIANADVVVADSISQSETQGEVYQARQKEVLNEQKLFELGQIINNPQLGRINDDQITVADLTGVAVQDIAIASAVYNQSKN